MLRTIITAEELPHLIDAIVNSDLTVSIFITTSRVYPDATTLRPSADAFAIALEGIA
jgi:hypothetical protein